MIPAKHFYMIRHGETEANAARIMAGSMDTPLTQNGRMQAQAVSRIMDHLHIKPKSIIHSHLSRARDTAATINMSLNVDMIEDSDFAELFAGDWEGVSYDLCNKLLTTWETPPNGESFDEFILRLKRGKNKYLSEKQAPVMIVCHGGVFRAFGKMYGLDILGVRNCHLYEFVPQEDNKDFPWKVWHYDIQEDGTIDRKQASVYHDPAARIAL
jgi:broad specificity phosphatase PhoE